ncbi:MAG: hypothetical protein V2I56_00865 [Desulfobacteraceae bacterium]|jgi:hypothetical protein|nr:hypothetical protein [Desulfobacteraceae bacterium]
MGGIHIIQKEQVALYVAAAFDREFHGGGWKSPLSKAGTAKHLMPPALISPMFRFSNLDPRYMPAMITS